MYWDVLIVLGVGYVSEGTDLRNPPIYFDKPLKIAIILTISSDFSSAWKHVWYWD